MPPERVARITASLEREQQERAHQTDAQGAPANVAPLVGRPSPGSSAPRHGSLGPSRLRRVVALGGAAAAVVAVAAVGTVIALDQRPGVPASASASSASRPASAADSRQEGSGALANAAPVYFEASGKGYTSAGFAQQARAMQAANHTPLRSDALQAPQVQELGPPTDLSQCIQTLGASLPSRPDKVWVDLGTFDGSPALIVVVTTDGKSTAWAVDRTCRAGQPSVLAGPTTLA
jgi:hypothetical protein